MHKTNFRFGNIARIYYEILNKKTPKQMEMIDQWFPGLVVITDPSDGNSKKEAHYEDREYVIHAVKYHGQFYSGGSTRISQILGRLIGTANANKEKERKSAELIQKHVAECLIKDITLTSKLKKNTMMMLEAMNEEQLNRMYQQLLDLIWQLAENRKKQDDYDRKTELFPMDDESFDGTIYNAGYQLQLATYNGLCNAYLWLLAGSLLRNEIGRVLRVYDSAFIAVRRQFSETDELEDQLKFLFYPEFYDYEKEKENIFSDPHKSRKDSTKM